MSVKSSTIIMHYVTATFTFKNDECSEKFKAVLSSEDGLKVTRAFKGCRNIECFTTEDNAFVIRQIWDTKEDHGAYLAMRKESGLFDSVMELLEKPFEVVHLTYTHF